MFVRDRMTADPVVTSPDKPVPEALALMREKKVRRLPVLDAKGKLVGIVAEKDIIYASPSPSTTLSVWEIHSLLDKIKVEKVMSKNPVTVSGDTPLEEAARLMAENEVGGLPVMREDRLVGIITETDLFRAFTDMLGGYREGVRITAKVMGGKGVMARIAQAVSDAGGDIVGLGVDDSDDDSGKTWVIVMKVQCAPRQKLVDALKPLVMEIVDARE